MVNGKYVLPRRSISHKLHPNPDPGIAYLTGDIANRVEGLSLEAHWYDGTDLPYELMTTGYTFEKTLAANQSQSV